MGKQGTWLSGEDLKIEKRRASKRADMDRRRTEDKPAVRHTNRLKTKDTKASRDRCRVCGEQLSFTTIDGVLVALNWKSLRPHRHQNG